MQSIALFEAYRQGQGVDSIAGAEALISHHITKNLLLPCAHAPAFAPVDVEDDISPKACAEEIGYTFLPCVLANLHRAPELVNLSQSNSFEAGLLTRQSVDAVVVPVHFYSLHTIELIMIHHPDQRTRRSWSATLHFTREANHRS